MQLERVHQPFAGSVLLARTLVCWVRTRPPLASCAARALTLCRRGLHLLERAQHAGPESTRACLERRRQPRASIVVLERTLTPLVLRLERYAMTVWLARTRHPQAPQQ